MASSHLFWAIGCLLIATAAAMPATEHIVGGSVGWTTPPSKDFYQDWAKGRKFVVGDKLVFRFTPSAHNLIEVTEREFEFCTQHDVIEMYYRGHTVIELDRPGTRYFYCGIGLHCEYGQKLEITVEQ
ncbi:mavicyanin-like [Aristolochia californica]|uniref:mavicyanin-like n=1 Tax=Aristolochia californica TaxID=171875 RepID=UPI0035D8241A